MKLYFSPGVCSLASHIVIRELNLPVSLVKVDLNAKKFGNDENYLVINKKGYVPALEFDDGTLLTEGVAILQYLADLKPEAKLVPEWGSRERYKLQEWLTFISSEIHKSFSPLFYKSTPEETRKYCLDKLHKRFNYVAEQLEHHNFLMGDQFTVADAYLYTTMTWGSHFKVDFSKWPTLEAYKQRVAERTSVQEAQAAEKAA
ncbi:MAG TPA: glutathione transferase GstA [Cellvibrio sp.]|nr:glutathione transferase GstA [Cellvibrio sp.]